MIKILSLNSIIFIFFLVYGNCNILNAIASSDIADKSTESTDKTNTNEETDLSKEEAYTLEEDEGTSQEIPSSEDDKGYFALVNKIEKKLMLCVRHAFIECRMCSSEGFNAMARPCFEKHMKELKGLLSHAVEEEMNNIEEELMYEF